MPDTELADLWTRIQDFCLQRGWNAELFVSEAPAQFGRVGARVEQALGYSYQAFGNTTNAAIRNLALSMERDGFNA